MSGIEQRGEKVFPVDYRMLDEGSDPLGLVLGSRDLMFPDPQHHEVWLVQVLGSHLIEGYFVWKEEVARQVKGDAELEEFVGEAQRESKSEDVSAYLFQHTVLATSHYSSSGLSQINKAGHGYVSDKAFAESLGKRDMPLSHTYQAELWMDQVIWTKDEIQNGYRMWADYILNPSAWVESERIIGIPCMLELPVKTAGLPKAMNLGGMQFELRFSRFYVPVPTVKQHPYAMKFFDHLGADYEKVSDRAFKSRVFRRFDTILTSEAERIRKQRRGAFSSYSPTAGAHWLVEPIKVLDIGCGTGLYLDEATDWLELVGVDVSSKMCDVARVKVAGDGRKYKQVIHADAARIPDLEDQSVDLAMMSFVEIWMDRRGFIAVMKEVKRILRPDGALVFNLHNPYPGQIELMTDWLTTYCGYSHVMPPTIMKKSESDSHGYGDVFMVVVYK